MTDESIVQNEVPKEQAAPAEQPAEKMLKQSEVNEIVGRAKREAHEKALREAETKYAISNNQQQVAPAQSIGGVQQLTDDQIRRVIVEQAHRMSQEAIANKTAAEIEHKVNSVKEKYADHDEAIKKAKLAKIAERNPDVIYMINTLDNAGDVIYELGKNPSKLVNLMNVADFDQDSAMDDLRKLSQSIKDNESSLKAQSPADPLSQIKPSLTKTDNGNMTISDLRRQPNLRA
jgi:hypothetical protein